MIGFVVRRIGQAVIVLLGLTLLIFLLEHLLPNVARDILGNRATPQQIAQFNRANDLDRSVLYQYVHYLNQLLHGNLGFSYRLNRSVWAVIRDEAPRDLLLVGSSLVLAVIIAIPVGVAQAVKRNGLIDYTGTTVSFLLYSMPSFAFGLILIQIFAIQFHAFPPEAPQEASVSGMLLHPSGLALPVITLTLISYALFSRYMRSSALDTLAQDYIRTARAKGLPEHLVLWRHLLRNSLVPVATLVGLSLPAVLTAGLIVEQLFNFPGIGLQYFLAAEQTDYPVMLGITLLVGLTTVIGNLLADVAYAVLDPPRPVQLMQPAPLITEATGQDPEGGAVVVQGSVWRLILRTFVENKLAIIGISFVLVVVAFSFVGPLVYHTDQVHTNLLSTNLPPGRGRPLGTDQNGFDIMGRLMAGGQVSIEISIAIAIVATGLGALYGAAAGFFGGVLDTIMMRIVDIGLAVPVIFLFILLSVIYRPTKVLLIALLAGLAWLGPARLVRGETLSLRTRDYVQAVRSMGGGARRVILRHIVPNAIGTIVVNATFQIADAILILATLEYLGFSLPFPIATWGGMLSGGVAFLQDGYWWEVYPVLIAIVLTVVSFNFVGDALRDSLDVRMRQR